MCLIIARFIDCLPTPNPYLFIVIIKDKDFNWLLVFIWGNTVNMHPLT